MVYGFWNSRTSPFGVDYFQFICDGRRCFMESVTFLGLFILGYLLFGWVITWFVSRCWSFNIIFNRFYPWVYNVINFSYSRICFCYWLWFLQEFFAGVEEDQFFAGDQFVIDRFIFSPLFWVLVLKHRRIYLSVIVFFGSKDLVILGFFEFYFVALLSISEREVLLRTL
ncbi:hypothetical protein KFK09_003807 [Dendrobium nobile]|uniref:Uncharacterized protein n=1 Tax=Dendrobium nobile TaxID=94219 RepID=A0A8T3C4H6_DENNO|nr:hypothetical protein KFK09_003807 [Dendrobium nobile]